MNAKRCLHICNNTTHKRNARSSDYVLPAQNTTHHTGKLKTMGVVASERAGCDRVGWLIRMIFYSKSLGGRKEGRKEGGIDRQTDRRVLGKFSLV